MTDTRLQPVELPSGDAVSLKTLRGIKSIPANNVMYKSTMGEVWYQTASYI